MSAIFLFSTCHRLKTWFDLSRVKLFRNDPKGIKNYFELPRVKLQYMHEGNQGEIDFGSS